MADSEPPNTPADPFDAADLHFAAMEGDEARVRALIAAGRSLDAFDELAKTPLHYAAEHGRIEIMRVLLEAGADVNAHDTSRIGNTPLGEVAATCSPRVAELLIEFGADPRIPGWMQLTALQKAKARKSEEGRRVYALLKAAADRA